MLIERLEHRHLLAVIGWDGGGDGSSWNDPQNWDGDAVPGINDDVSIGAGFAGQTILYSGNTDATVRSLTSAAALHVSAGTLEILEDSTIDAQLRTSGNGQVLLDAMVMGGTGNIFNQAQGSNSGLHLIDATIQVSLINDGLLTSPAGSNSRISSQIDARPGSIIRVEAQRGNGDGTLTIDQSFDNRGEIELVHLSNITGPNYRARLVVSNGPLNNLGGGRISSSGPQNEINAVVDSAGTIDVASGLLRVANDGRTFHNTGIIAIADSAVLRIDEGLTRLASTASWLGDGIFDLAGTHTLQLDSDVHFTSASPELQLGGEVIVNGPGKLTIARTLRLDSDVINANIRNEGTLLVRRDAIEHVFATINGLLETTPDSLIRVEAKESQGNGTLTVTQGFTNFGRIELEQVENVSGGVDFTARMFVPGGIVLAGGQVTGDGEIHADVTNNGGAIGATDLPGSLQIVGDYTQTTGGILKARIRGIGSANVDSINVSGRATLNGELRVELDGFTPTPGQTFDVLTASSISGSFAADNGIEVSADVIVGSTSVDVQFIAPTVVDGTLPISKLQKISGTHGGFAGVLDDGDQFGYATAGLGDLDGDGVTDIAVGARWDDDGGTNRGAVWILFLNSDGSVKSQQKISSTQGSFNGLLDDNDRFGGSIASLGDLNGDGNTDIAVGAAFDDDGGSNRGAVWILFLNADGTVNTHQKISDTAGGFTGTLQDGDTFAVPANIGDVNDDGVTDIAVGATGDDGGDFDRGAVWILTLNSNGTVNSYQKISQTEGGLGAVLQRNDRFGAAIASIGDLNGDGRSELAVGARGTDDGGIDRGALWILHLNADGTVDRKQKISSTDGYFQGPLSDSDFFGGYVAGVGDIDGDGWVEVAVGAASDDDDGSDRGAAWILSLNSAGLVAAQQKISSPTGALAGELDDGDRFGHVAIVGDVNSDGIPELIVGAEGDDDGGLDESANRGAIYVLSMAQPVSNDFGDAPIAYPVGLADDGARHAATGPTLGLLRDAETDGLPSALADGDDNNATADEDGVTFDSTSLIVSSASGTTGRVDVELQNADPTSNLLDGWIDFNQDGDWDDSGEQVFDGFDLGTSNGIQTLTFTIPQDTGTNVKTGATFARFRVTTDSSVDVLPTGAASDGEVEDLRLFLLPEVTVSPAGQTVNEDVGDATITVQLSTQPDQDVSVPFTLGGTATSGAENDFYASVASPIVFVAGDSPSQDLVLTIVDDGAAEPIETIDFALQSTAGVVSGSPSRHQITIHDNDFTTLLTISSATVDEGATAQFSIGLSTPVTYDVTVTLITEEISADAPSDFTATSGTVTISAGQTVASSFFSVETNSDFLPEPAERFRVVVQSLDQGFGVDTSAIGLGTILNVNHPPTAGDDEVSTKEDQFLDIAIASLLANDNDPDGNTLTFHLESQPAHGTATVMGSSVRYQPDANYSNTLATRDSFTYRVEDVGGELSNSAIVRVLVTPTGDPFVTMDDEYFVVQDETLLVGAPGLLRNDSDPDNTPDANIAIEITSPTSAGVTQILSPPGRFSYEPNSGFVGSDQFSYRVDTTPFSGDNQPRFSNASDVVIHVHDGVAPSVTDQIITLAPNGQYAFTASGFIDSISSDLPIRTIRIESVPVSGTLTLFGTEVSVGQDITVSNLDHLLFDDNGAPNLLAREAFSFTAFDGILQSPPATITFNHTPTLTTPSSRTILEDFSFQYRASAPNVADLDADSLTAIVSVDSGSLSFSQSSSIGTVSGSGTASITFTGTAAQINQDLFWLRYTPPADFFGSATVSFEIDDGLSTMSTMQPLTVSPVNDAPSFLHDGDVTALAGTTATLPGWAGEIMAGPSNESAQSLSFVIQNQNPTLFIDGPTIDADGTLRFQSDPAMTGQATVKITLIDDAGTDNGGVDRTDVTFTIEIVDPTVTTLLDESDGVGQGTGTSLRELLDIANLIPGLDVIRFADGLAGTSNMVKQLSVDDDVSVIGPGAGVITLAGATGFRVLEVDAGAAEVSGLTISAGEASDRGGTVLNQSGLTLHDVIIRDGTAIGGGGGIANDGSLTISDSVLGYHTAGGDGGAIFNSGELIVSGTRFERNASLRGGAVFNSSGATATLQQVSIVTGTADQGAGIFNDNGELDLRASLVADNAASGDGAGIYNDGVLTLVNTTLSGNGADGSGGGFLHAGGTTQLTHVTIANNRADTDGDNHGQGGGIRSISGIATLHNTIVANNAGPQRDISGQLDPASSFNIVGEDFGSGLANGANGNQIGVADAGLEPLADNGGPTLTHALVFTSVALDAGSDQRAADARAATDQRGQLRPFHLAVDVGAFESQGFPNEAPTIDPVADLEIDEDALLTTVQLTGLSPGIGDTEQQIGISVTTNTPHLFDLLEIEGDGSDGTSKLHLQPRADANGIALFNVEVVDNGFPARSVSAEFVVRVNPVNDSPVLNTAAVLQLDPIGFNHENPDGVRLVDLLNSALPIDVITDIDAAAQEGIAIVSDASNGLVQYSLDAGVTWNAAGPFVVGGDPRVRLLPTDAHVRVIPDSGFIGSTEFQFRAWDRTQGSVAESVDPASIINSLSTLADGVTVEVFDTRPTLDSSGDMRLSSIGVDETDNVGTSIVDLLASVAPIDPISHPTITTEGIAISDLQDSDGTWQFSTDDGASWSDVGPLSEFVFMLPLNSPRVRTLVADTDTRLRFQPNPGFVGIASLSFYAWNQGQSSNGALVDPAAVFESTSSNVETASIAVGLDGPDQNERPILNTIAEYEITGVLEQATNSEFLLVGERGIADLLSSVAPLDAISDPDANALEGIAIQSFQRPTEVMGSQDIPVGSWEYSLDFGNNWQEIPLNCPSPLQGQVPFPPPPAVCNDVAGRYLLLPNDNAVRIRYQRMTTNETFADGFASVNFFAWDQTFGNPGQLVDSGLLDFFHSTSEQSANISYSEDFNFRPQLGDMSVTLPSIQAVPDGLHETSVISLVLDAAIQDANLGSSLGIAITSVDDSNGLWQHSLDNGTTWQNTGPLVADGFLGLDTNAKVRFVPEPTFRGDATFTFRGWDQTIGNTGGFIPESDSLSLDAATARLPVTNNRPTMDPSGDMTLFPVEFNDFDNLGTSVGEMFASVAPLAPTFDPNGDSVGIAIFSADETNGTWQYSIDGGFSWANVGPLETVTLVIFGSSVTTQEVRLVPANNSRLRFIPDANYSGPAHVEFYAWDGTRGTPGEKSTAFEQSNAISELTETVVTEVLPALDQDADGIPDSIEDNAPNSGDGNLDGIEDSRQANVSSLPNDVDGNYLTIAAPSEMVLVDVVSSRLPPDGFTPNDASLFPFGYLRFTLNGLAAGGDAIVDVIPAVATEINQYFKYGRTPEKPMPDEYTFSFDGITGAELLPDRIRLHFVDGQRGDDDLVANGVIVDPGAAALNPPPIVDPLTAPDAVTPYQPFVIETEFSDLGDEPHFATVDWGDGTVEPANLNDNAGAESVTASHVYSAPGTYSILLSVSDAFGNVSDTTETVTVQSFVVQTDPNDPTKNSMFVGGTPGKDKIELKAKDDDRKVEVKLNGKKLGRFDLTTLSRIVAFGGDGKDVIIVDNDLFVSAELHGGDDNDVLNGGSGDDTLHGGDGNDRIFGRDGHDWVDAGDGNDFVRGGMGDDQLFAGDGRDRVFAGSGDDVVDGGDGDDRIHAGRGDDFVLGGSGNDFVRGGRGNDRLLGQSGNDQLRGEQGDDLLIGGEGNDTLIGGPGLDQLVQDDRIRALQPNAPSGGSIDSRPLAHRHENDKGRLAALDALVLHDTMIAINRNSHDDTPLAFRLGIDVKDDHFENRVESLDAMTMIAHFAVVDTKRHAKVFADPDINLDEKDAHPIGIEFARSGDSDRLAAVDQVIADFDLAQRKT